MDSGSKLTISKSVAAILTRSARSWFACPLLYLRCKNKMILSFTEQLCPKVCVKFAALKYLNESFQFYLSNGKLLFSFTLTMKLVWESTRDCRCVLLHFVVLKWIVTFKLIPTDQKTNAEYCTCVKILEKYIYLNLKHMALF